MTIDLQLRTRPLMPGFGVEIFETDLKTAGADARQQVVDRFHENGAILLRNQDMTPDDLMSFIDLFGDPEDHTQTQFTLPGYPKIFILSNRIVDGRSIGAHNDGVGWHTDYSYKEEPVMCTMLYAVEVPPEGSDTLLADLCAAYNELPDERKAQLDKLILHHSYQHLMSTRQFGRMELSDEMKAANPDVYHPLVRSHPADGRKALWVSTGTVKGIVGMDDDAALALLDELVEFVTNERFVYRHKWQVGDILMWDNRCTLHTGTVFDDTKYIRLMHRLWVKGDKPF
ncbi:TauD/TfdA family dioxygenase [Parvibaculum sp.]|uniref:TauD/TfdA dioxygenase family protein n=1 Tax=Parvibaculum sp. TaxID=2024848 RepID=UPI0027313C34|nr:TauD/TfdA family dioxygenase [Parvibaculum sp.]MDP1627597.1 TauD/TfdA family dioxygenase [Parvibaculum sp.]MDP2148776.1 TauD/TfdA family dioxygenase [Parvibaculum sp.]MDP3328700.1 TauD/TfdA family dioxygenase [Parvibaculum sp.]